MGTAKHAAFQVLKNYGGSEGMTAAEILTCAVEREIKTDWSENGRRNLGHVLRTDEAFVKVSKLKYGLRAMPGVMAYTDEVRAAQ